MPERGDRILSPVYGSYFVFDGTYWTRDQDQTEGETMAFTLYCYPFDGPEYGPFLDCEHTIRISHPDRDGTERMTYSVWRRYDYAATGWTIHEIDPRPNVRITAVHRTSGRREFIWLERFENAYANGEWFEYIRLEIPASVECANCLEVVDQAIRTYSDAFVCVACGEDMVECDDCSEIDDIDIMRQTIEDGHICPNHRNYRPCSECHRYELRSYLSLTDQGDAMCGNCAETNYYTSCESCEVLTRNGCYCNSCENEYDEDEYDSCGGLISDYDYRPDPVFHGADTEDGIPYLGIELEVSTNGNMTGCALIAADQMSGLGYLKEDSSIDSGFEIVSHPMTHEYARTQFPWGMLSALVDNGADADDNGIHIHVSRKGFTDNEHIYRFMRLIMSNEEQCIKIARRPGHTHWCRFRRFDEQNVRAIAYKEQYTNRYEAINMQNDHTIELRLFRGSLDKTEVMSAFDLAHASVEYTRNNESPDWDSFSTWLDSHSNEYSALIAQNGK